MGEELKQCPFCGSKEGYYMLEKAHRYLVFDFNNTPDGASEDVTEYTGKRKYCRSCYRILPRNKKGE